MADIVSDIGFDASFYISVHRTIQAQISKCGFVVQQKKLFLTHTWSYICSQFDKFKVIVVKLIIQKTTQTRIIRNKNRKKLYFFFL